MFEIANQLLTLSLALFSTMNGSQRVLLLKRIKSAASYWENVYKMNKIIHGYLEKRNLQSTPQDDEDAKELKLGKIRGHFFFKFGRDILQKSPKFQCG